MSDTRLNYIKYDKDSQVKSHMFKGMIDCLIGDIENNLDSSEQSSLAVTKLEEAFMWIGKAIRNEQIKRDNNCEHLEARNNN